MDIDNPRKVTRKKLRTGSCSQEELEYISEHMDSMSPEDIAKHLHRRVSFVKKYMGLVNYQQQLKSKDSYIFKLKASPFWPQTKKNLTNDEIEFFEQCWASYCDQLSTVDILPTDELTIKDLIILDITCNRVLATKMQIMQDIRHIQNMLTKETEKETRDTALIATLNEQLNNLRNYEYKQDTYYKDIQAKKTAKLNALKATRDQRLKNMEESKRNIWELLKDLDTKKMREKEGKINAKVRVAVDELAKKWKQPTKYADGHYDSIYLTPEDIKNVAYPSNER